MDKNDIELGKHYAIREHPNDDFQHGEIFESVRSATTSSPRVGTRPGRSEQPNAKDGRLFIESGADP